MAPPAVCAASLTAVISAIIFDLDGTLVDTEPTHFAAFVEVLTPLGAAPSWHDYLARWIGYNDRDCIGELLKESGRPDDPALVEELLALKAEAYMRLLGGRELLYPGAQEFVRRAAGRFALALVTGTLRTEAERLLERTAMRELFPVIVAAEDVSRGKPAPDGFVEALARLGRGPLRGRGLGAADCLVVEDTVAGVRAARGAGMRVLAVAHTTPAAELAEADLVRPSLQETDLDEVLRLLAHP